MIEGTDQAVFGTEGEQLFYSWLQARNKNFQYYDWNTPEGKQFQLKHIDFWVENLGYCDVKYDGRISQTGNFYLEYQQYCGVTGTYGSSALFDSEADCIVYICSENHYCWILDTNKTKDYCRSHDLRVAGATDGRIDTKGFLISVSAAEEDGLILHSGYLRK